MRRVIIPGTSLSVSRLSFGTASLHHLFSEKARLRLLDIAFAHGISHFDTSPLYGFGVGEHTLGRFAQQHAGQISITSKVGLYPHEEMRFARMHVWGRKAIGKLVPSLNRPIVNWSVEKASTSLEQTLRQLFIETLDVLVLHEPIAGLVGTDEFLGWLEKTQSSGKIRNWGVAGEISGILPWVVAKHPIAAIVQTRDSSIFREADPLLETGRSLQFTYGYLAAAKRHGEKLTVEHSIRDALKRNFSGSIIISSRDCTHLQNILALASE